MQQLSDDNFTYHSGVVHSSPSWVSLANNKRALIFTLKNVERFFSGENRPAEHDNYFQVEVLGKNAEKYERDLKIGLHIRVKGYLRDDELAGGRKTRIRAFTIEYASGNKRI